MTLEDCADKLLNLLVADVCTAMHAQDIPINEWQEYWKKAASEIVKEHAESESIDFAMHESECISSGMREHFMNQYKEYKKQ